MARKGMKRSSKAVGGAPTKAGPSSKGGAKHPKVPIGSSKGLGKKLPGKKKGY